MPHSERKIWIDYWKGGAIIFIVLFHTCIMTEIQTLAYLLSLPSFFFMAGIFADCDMNLWNFFCKKTLRLLIPYLLWGLIGWLLWVLIGRKYGYDASGTLNPWWQPLWGMMIGNVEKLAQNAPLWFLCCLMLLEWMYYIIHRIPSVYIRILITIGIGGAGCYLGSIGWRGIWSASPAMIMFPVYMAGVASARILLRENLFSYLSTWHLVLILCISTIGFGMGCYWNNNIDIAVGKIANPFLFYMTAFSAVGLGCTTCILLDKLPLQLHLLNYIGRNTLLILCMHILIFGGIKGVTLFFHVPLSFYETNLGSIFLWISSLIVLLPMIRYINRFAPVLSGKLPKITP